MHIIIIRGGGVIISTLFLFVVGKSKFSGISFVCIVKYSQISKFTWCLRACEELRLIVAKEKIYIWRKNQPSDL